MNLVENDNKSTENPILVDLDSRVEKDTDYGRNRNDLLSDISPEKQKVTKQKTGLGRIGGSQ